MNKIDGIAAGYVIAAGLVPGRDTIGFDKGARLKKAGAVIDRDLVHFHTEHIVKNLLFRFGKAGSSNICVRAGIATYGFCKLYFKVSRSAGAAAGEARLILNDLAGDVHP